MASPWVSTSVYHGADEWDIKVLGAESGDPHLVVYIDNLSVTISAAVFEDEHVNAGHVEFAKALHEAVGEYVFELDRLAFIDGAASAV